MVTPGPLNENSEIDDEIAKALTELIREHVPGVSTAGRVVQFVVGARWADESPAQGTYAFFNGTPDEAHDLTSVLQANFDALPPTNG